jgi:hypothetical protein
VACNALPLGPKIPVLSAALPAPSPAGGTIHEGVYVLTAASYYGYMGVPAGYPTGPSIQMTFQISGNQRAVTTTDFYTGANAPVVSSYTGVFYDLGHALHLAGRRLSRRRRPDNDAIHGHPDHD